MTRRHARAVALGLSRALTTPHASPAPTCLGRSSACLGSSARSVRARLRRWMLPGRVVLRARRGRSLTQRRRGVSTASETAFQARASAKSVPLTRSHALVGYHVPTQVELRAWTAPTVKPASMANAYALLGRTNRLLAQSHATSTKLTRSSQRPPKNRACRVDHASIAEGTLQFLFVAMCGSIQ
jgi:hypothetical protein